MDNDRMNDQNSAPKMSTLVFEVIGRAFDLPEPEYHRLFLFDKLVKGGKDWHFLIVTRKTEKDRLEMVAFSFELAADGSLQTTLESRKASIPEGRLNEVIDGLLFRIDEIDCDYREIDIEGLSEAPEKLEYLQKLLGEEPDESAAGEKKPDDLQSG